jgi:hypothetical protein
MDKEEMKNEVLNKDWDINKKLSENPIKTQDWENWDNWRNRQRGNEEQSTEQRLRYKYETKRKYWKKKTPATTQDWEKWDNWRNRQRINEKGNT